MRDDVGYHWFIGRADDVIVTSGYNVGPFEVESAILLHPAVAESALVGQSAPAQRRQGVCRPRRRRRPNDVLYAELQAVVSEKVGRHASPREVEFIAELPRTTTGKIQRAELRRREQESSA